MKSSVITSETSPAHFIENYRFKVLGSNERAQDSAPVLIEENNLSEELNEQNLEQGGENFTPQNRTQCNQACKITLRLNLKIAKLTSLDLTRVLSRSCLKRQMS